ncbi:MAG: flavodoxin family protein [Hyphomicrobiaceae bacterium]
MARLAIVYYSATGNTHRLAETIREGAGKHGEAELCRIVGADMDGGRFRNESLLQRLDAADGIVFGSPTFMGGPAAQFKAFADATSERWTTQLWADKVAAGFTTGSCLNGDQSATLSYFSILASQHGMIWCGLDIPSGYDPAGRNRLGTQLGLATETAGDAFVESDLVTAAHLGARVARLAARLSSG